MNITYITESIMSNPELSSLIFGLGIAIVIILMMIIVNRWLD